MLVKDIITKCDTGLARGLNLQLIAKMNRMVKAPILVEVKHELIDTSSAACNPYLQLRAKDALIKAVELRGEKTIVNSMLRTTVQQHLLKQQCNKGLCGITACAPPGKGGHENGRSLDLEDPYGWEPWLERTGWSKLGDWDRMHFDFWDSRNDIAKLQITAFQMLWNQFNPTRIIAVDGSYGPITADCINNSPLAGW
jgi:hypothetical protein